MKKKYFNYQKTGAIILGKPKEPFCKLCGYELGTLQSHICPINVKGYLSEYFDLDNPS